MRRALIGHTGFVGSNLLAQQEFTDCFNSRNFRDMAGQHFDEVVCAGIQAVKWWANQNPKEDWQAIADLISVLSTVTTDRLVLISTVDVYKTPVQVNEASALERNDIQPYGSHRLQAEDFIRAEYDNHLIVRLPGLFGRGLKKNLIYDALVGKDLSGFDHRSRFQFYNLAHLSDDISRLSEHPVQTANLATEPVSVGSVVAQLTGKSWSNELDQQPVNYDMQTTHGELWGHRSQYIRSADQTLDEIRAFGACFKENEP